MQPRPSNDTFSACYRFFASWGGLKRHPSFPLQMTLRRNSDRSATALARWWCHGGRRSDRRRGPDAPAGNGHTKEIGRASCRERVEIYVDVRILTIKREISDR